MILALDGHDASGKSTLSRRLAAALDAQIVRPFAGEEGILMLNAAEQGQHDRAWEVAITAKERVERLAQQGPVICDRWWLTVFSLVPASFQSSWEPRSPAVVCWCDLATTVHRLKARPEPPLPPEYHAHYLALYLSLAERWQCDVLRTDVHDEDHAFAHLLAWASRHLGRTADVGSLKGRG